MLSIIQFNFRLDAPPVSVWLARCGSKNTDIYFFFLTEQSESEEKSWVGQTGLPKL